MADIVKILLRRDSETNWAAANPILGVGEPAISLDSEGKLIGLKIGDGESHWSEIEYFTGDYTSLSTRVTNVENSVDALNAEINGTEETDGLATELHNLEAVVNDETTGLSALNTKVSNQGGVIEANSESIIQLQSGKENASNKVISLSKESTDIQYPSARAVYNADERLEDLIDTEELNRKNADTLIHNEITDINNLIPEQASIQNKLADKEFVNSSISTNTATFRGTFNIVTDLGLTTSALEQEIVEALETKFIALGITPTNNDYCFVSYPDSTDPNQFTKYDRYKYSENIWEFEYTLNNSSFTASQWAAINSGATAEQIAKIGNAILNTTAQDLSAAVNELNSTKQDTLTFDNTPTQDSNNPVKSGGVYTSLQGKQDTLTAGTNITIDQNNVISATGAGAEALTTQEMETICVDILYPALPAPEDVEVTSEPNEVTLSFDEVQGAESYEIFANGVSIGEYTPEGGNE